MKCQFCGCEKKQKPFAEILDAETLRTIDVCLDCAREIGQIDSEIENQIETLQFQRAGIPI